MSFLQAVAFLTRLPVTGRRGEAVVRDDLAGAAVWFPLVGAILGAGLLASGVLGSQVLPVLVVAVLLVLAEVLLTGGLHLDGLADTADAVGGWDRESRLRIMKDHATGVYGTAAVVLALLLRVALLAGLLATALDTGGGMQWQPVLVGATAYALSRGAMLPVAVTLPYARTEGTGKTLIEGLGWPVVLLALFSVPVALVALVTMSGGWSGVAMTAAAALAALVVAGWAKRKLGGATGDVLGATAEVALAAALLAAVAVS